VLIGHLARLGLAVLFVAGAVVLVSGALIASAISQDEEKDKERDE